MKEIISTALAGIPTKAESADAAVADMKCTVYDVLCLGPKNEK